MTATADPAPHPAPHPPATTRRVGSAVAWLVMLCIVGIAGAGLILTLDHAPTEEGRPELTARGARIVEPRLAAIDADMLQAAAAGDDIAAAGRQTLTRLRSLDPQRVDAALTAGDTAVADLVAARDRIVAARATLLDGTTSTALPAADRVRIGAIDSAIAAVGELPGYWDQVRFAASAPQELVEDLAAHDARVVAATDAGRAGQWADALARLSNASRYLGLAQAVRETAHQQGLDVTTLDDLLDRLATYDTALTDLYSALQASDGRTTRASSAAEARVNTAQAELPQDQTALVVIVSDLAGPTITPTLLSIESARGALEAVLDSQPQPSDGVAS